MTIADLLSLLLIAISLSADCFAVALCGCVSQKKLKYSQILRTGAAFGLAQSLMPVIGWSVGRVVVNYISGYAYWVAFGLLLVVGGRMIWEAVYDNRTLTATDITRGWLLVTMALATSIDALAVGIGFAFLKTNIVFASLTIGIVAFLITLLGFYLGRHIGALLGERAKLIGGIILIAIGIRLLVQNL